MKTAWISAVLCVLVATSRTNVGVARGGTIGAANRTGVREVIVVFKTHFDIGYTDMASNIVAKYRTTMIDKALDVVDQNRDLPSAQQFVWTIPGWPMHKILEDWPGQSGERKERILKAFSEGRFVVHALPFTTHTELLEAEDLVRGMEYAAMLTRATGKPLPRDAKMTDVPSHSWILPTLLRHSGVEFLHLGCNAASRSPHIPRLFWWEGPDGSRLLTMYTAESYGTGLVPPADWGYSTWLALIHTGDNHGPPTPEEVRQLLERAKRDLPGVNVRIGRLSDFADTILADKPELPVIRGDMPDTWIHGPMSDPRGAGIARNVRPALATGERLNALMAAWGVRLPGLATTFRTAYENSLLYGEHTWGGAFWWISGKYELPFGEAWNAERAAGKFRRIESSWDEHTAYIESAQKLATEALDLEVSALAAAVDVAGPRVVVFNPLPVKRTGLVTLNFPGQAPAGLKAVDGGRIESIEVRDQRCCFLAREIPAMGYRTYRVVKSVGSIGKEQSRAEGNIMETRLYRLTLDPAQATIRSWLDKRSGRELVDAKAPQGFGQYLYERFDRDQVQGFVKAYVKIKDAWGVNELGKPSMPPSANVPYRAASPTNFTLHFERGAVGITAVLQAAPGAEMSHGVTTRVNLYDDLPYVDLELTVHNKAPDPWPEAGWLCLPFRVKEPHFQLMRLGGMVDPAKDIVPGCNFDLLALNGGVAVVGADRRGVGLCTLDSPLVSLGEPGGWKYSGEWKSPKGRVFVNLFNNQWSTNFRLWNSGTWTSRVRLWPVNGGNLERNLVSPAEEARFPLVAGFAEGAAGHIQPVQAGLALSRGGVKVTAFARRFDGGGTVLRLWEMAGMKGTVSVELPHLMRPAAVQPVDLREQPCGRPIPVHKGRFQVQLGAFAPAAFVIPN